jgi:hypothetical protein
VLQHARMYGYRRKDIGLLRLFLPRELHVVFKAINKMERGLRELIAQAPTEEFRGIYVEGSLSATRGNILAPGSIGVYSGGSTYNPAQVLRDSTVTPFTKKINQKLEGIPDKQYRELPMSELRTLIELTSPDQSESERVWDPVAVSGSIEQLALLRKQQTGYVYVDRNRGLLAQRRETQGILDSGEAGAVPDDKCTLFLLRTTGMGDKVEAWWPQIRFPKGRYAFAFTL